MSIRKIDYYVGAVLSYLIKKRITPAIFDSSDCSKIITFETNEGKYNLFVKYSGKPASQQEKYSRWDVTFTKLELEIVNTYAKDGFNNFVVLVCSSESLTQTEIAVIEVKNALRCLGNDNINKQKRISIINDKGARKLKCYGTAITDKNAILIKRNIDNYF